ncbi:formyltransferase family protein [Labrys sp. La1]|uniref:formyltransferase family protein n=1 Tax=Labrys sp. La1 TaxID=3404917 RepID=UPI003EC0251B
MVDSTNHNLIIFADGPVGFEIVKFAFSNFATNLSGVVVTDKDNEIADFVRAGGRQVEVIEWRKPDTQIFLSKLRELRSDIFLLAWWPYIVKDELACGQAVTLNFHPSLLPYCRGQNPNFWSLVSGEPYGVSIHHVVPEIDAGPIAFQWEIPYSWSDTGGSLYRKGQDAIVELFKANYQRILALDIPAEPQHPDLGSFHWARELDPNSHIDLDAPTTARDLFNRLRARTFRPYRGCRFTDGNNTYDVRIEISKVR